MRMRFSRKSKAEKPSTERINQARNPTKRRNRGAFFFGGERPFLQPVYFFTEFEKSYQRFEKNAPFPKLIQG